MTRFWVYFDGLDGKHYYVREASLPMWDRAVVIDSHRDRLLCRLPYVINCRLKEGKRAGLWS